MNVNYSKSSCYGVLDLWHFMVKSPSDINLRRKSSSVIRTYDVYNIKISFVQQLLVRNSSNILDHDGSNVPIRVQTYGETPAAGGTEFPHKSRTLDQHVQLLSVTFYSLDKHSALILLEPL